MNRYDPLKAAFDEMSGHAPERDDLFVLRVQEQLQKRQMGFTLLKVLFWSVIFGLVLAFVAPMITDSLLVMTVSDWAFMSVLLSVAVMIYGFNRTFRWLT